MCLGANVSGHKHVLAQTCVGTKLCGHKCVMAQTCMGTIESCHKSVWEQTCLGTNVSGHKSVWAQTCQGIIVWAQVCMGTNVWSPSPKSIKKSPDDTFRSRELRCVDKSRSLASGPSACFFCAYIFALSKSSLMAWLFVVCSFDAMEATAFVGLVLFITFFLLIIDAADRPGIALEESSFVSELVIFLGSYETFAR